MDLYILETYINTSRWHWLQGCRSTWKDWQMMWKDPMKWCSLLSPFLFFWLFKDCCACSVILFVYLESVYIRLKQTFYTILSLISFGSVSFWCCVCTGSFFFFFFKAQTTISWVFWVLMEDFTGHIYLGNWVAYKLTNCKS